MCLALFCLVWLGAAHAAGEPSGQAASQVDYSARINELQAQIQSLKSQKDLAEAEREHAVQTYQQAVAALKTAQADAEKTQKLQQAAKEAPQEIEKAQKALADLQKPVAFEKLTGLSLDDLSSRADKLRGELSNAQSNLSDLRDQLTRAAERPDQARAALAEARQKLQSLGSAPEAPGAASESGGVTGRAQSALTSARRAKINAEIGRLQAELSGQDSHERLLEAQRSLAEARVARLNESLARVQTALSQKQQESAASLQNQSESKLSELRWSLKPISDAAQRNVDLTEQLAKITQQTERLSAVQSRQRAQVDNLERRLNLVQRQLEIGAGSVALGDVLRNQRRQLGQASLPSAASVSGGQPDVSTAELKRFQLQQDRAELNNPETVAGHLAAQAGVTLDKGQRESLIHLLKQRRSILDMLIDAEGRYVDIGRELHSLKLQYHQTWTSFNRLLDERLFWLPSFHPIDRDWPKRVAGALPWAINPAQWQQVGAALVAGVAARPIRAGLSVLLLVVLLALRRPMRRRLAYLGQPVGNVSRDTIWLTLRALLITVLLALPSIVIPMLFAYFTGQAPKLSAFTRAAAAAFFQLGMLWLFIAPFTNITRPHGLADRHFQWPSEARATLNRSLYGLVAAMTVPVVLIVMTAVFDDDAKRETLGRAAFMFNELVLAAFAWRIVHPRLGVLAKVMRKTQGGSWPPGYFWLPVAGGAPLGLAALAGWGYYYTALQLQSRFFYSAALLGGAVVVYSLIVRWLTVVERRLALARARRKREEAREVRAARESAAASGDSAPDTLEGLEIDLVQINEQTRGLIKIVITLIIGAGLWFIWSDTLPALQLLNKINLWQYATRINGQTQVTSVTLGALLLAIAIGVVTALAGRNLPGFLEITLLRRFSLDSGSRYAMATLFQYAIVIMGLLAAVNLIGLHWSSIQWLIAAIGVGLGFGLQEIFANFVSGLVILFERPVRVGDTVTVGSLTGTVSRIRIRATTVTDWDNKEVVIPNKTFITETVINWTLTDDITRLIVKVGVGYDSDPELVEKLIYQAIRDEPVALETPAPSVFMVGYGDSAILFEGRVFYHDLYNLLPLQHALYRRILDNFRANGVEIVFPQQDLHIRSIDERITEQFRQESSPARRLGRRLAPRRTRARDAGADQAADPGGADGAPEGDG